MSKRLGKRERAALAAIAMKRKTVTAANLKRPATDSLASMRETRAYAPPPERLTQYARCRVMHNAQGSVDPREPKYYARFSTK